MKGSCEMSVSTIYIFVEKRNHRIQYVASEIFDRRLGMETVLLSDLDDFEAHTGPKLNYSTQSVSDGIPCLSPAGILFEKRIQPQEVELESDPDPILFPIRNHALGFDPLAACFYLLSRYEEYLPHREDEHGRYQFDQSLIVKAGLHRRPLVEEFTERMWNWLKEFYPALERHVGAFDPQITIDVDQLFSMKAKGLVRSMLSTARDTLRGKLLERSAVMLGRKLDPNDIYDRVSSLMVDAKSRPLYFFQVGESSRYDINNPPHLYAVRQRINEIALNGGVGLHPSYYTSERPELLTRELDRLRQITSSGMVLSRQHYLRFRLPQTFRELAERGVTDDYSMGFHDRNGFRAGTCKPFALFDLEKDETIQLLMHPMTWMDLSSMREHPREADAWNELADLIEKVKLHGGECITTWHPEVLVASNEHYSSWNLLERYIQHA